MRLELTRFQVMLARQVGWPARLLLFAAVLALAFVFRSPLWTLSFESNQYPDPLVMSIFASHLEGNKTAGRDDLAEINSLNHYIGMRSLTGHDFPEFVWLPLTLVALGLILLRAAFLGDRRAMADAIALYTIFAAFSGWTFYRRMYEYGHSLAADAPIKVEPFTPPLFGRVKIANFWVESYPGAASFAVIIAGLLVFAAWGAAWWWDRRNSRTKAAVKEAVAV
jgi:hypothetical protein